MDVWYLEAFCRSGSTHRDWRQTVIPHKTELLSASEDGKRLLLKTVVEPKVELLHEIVAAKDEITFEVEAVNHGDEFVDVQWFHLVCGWEVSRALGSQITMPSVSFSPARD